MPETIADAPCVMPISANAENAYAKINLTLQVVGRRPDGYHLLDSVVIFAQVGDRVTTRHAETLSLDIVGPQAAGLQAEADNLVLRAARALATEAGAPATAFLELEKNLPVSSGIGGGSADAAATLRLLRRTWGAAIDDAVLHRIAAGLGSDVPVCLRQQPIRMQATGDVLTALPPLPSFGLVLANPGVAVSTQAVFRERAANETAGEMSVPPGGWSDLRAFVDWLQAHTNDLQPASIRLCPVIAETIATIAATPDCLMARMSGSGATCFGIYPTARDAEQAADRLKRAGWWVWGGAALHAAHG